MRHALNIIRLLMDPRVVLPPVRAVEQLETAARSDMRSVHRGSSRWSRCGQRLRALEFMRRLLRRERLRRHRGQWVINSFFPPFPGPAYERMFAKLLAEPQVRPLSAFLAVTHDCPADCWHCSLKDRRHGTAPRRDQWLDVISQLNRLGTSLIGFTGGEPLLCEYLSELVAEADRGGAATQLFTSGLGATVEQFHELSDAGLWAVGVSLDHTDADVVNRLRRNSQAYAAAMAALRMARQAGFYTFINAVASRGVIESGEHRRLYDLAAQLDLQEVRFLEPKPCGRLAAAGQSHALDVAHTATLRRFHRAMNRRGRGPKVCAFSEIESAELFGCVAGTAHLYVDPSGNVCPCDFTPLSFGDITQEPLETIWQRMSGAIRQPRCQCLIQSHHELIAGQSAGHEFPLPPDVSCRIAAQMPAGPLPGFFHVVSQPLGFFLY